MTHDRRSFLTAMGVAGVSVVAGCSSSETDDTTSAKRQETATTTQRESETTETATATEVDTTERATATPEEAQSGPRSASHIDPDDGFAELAPWLEDDTPVYTVEEPTRQAFVEALANTGPRVIAFETSGTIDLDGEWIEIQNDKCWIAGQTAPSPGITFVRGRVRLGADDCVLQHVRVRPGDDGAGDNPASLDAIDTDDDTQNNVIDHCSASWSTDEVLSIGYQTNKTTVTNCLIYEGLNDSIHPKGEHGYGSLTGNGAERVFYAGNVWAHNVSRNPRLKSATRSAVVNNVVYHFNEATNLDDDTIATIRGNAYLRVDEGDAVIEGGQALLEDNYTEPETPITNSVSEMSFPAPSAWTDSIPEPMGAEAAIDHNLANAGARPADRTDHDERIVNQVRERTGDYLDSQSAVGGYPELPEHTHTLEIPDSNLEGWLRQHALDVEQ